MVHVFAVNDQTTYTHMQFLLQCQSSINHHNTWSNDEMDALQSELAQQRKNVIDAGLDVEELEDN